MPKKPKRKLKLSLARPRVVALLFVIIFGVIGSVLLYASHATTYELQFKLALDTGLCMDNDGNSTASKNKVVQWDCSTTDTAQQWSIESESSGGFLIKDTAGTCADDTGDAVGKSSSDRVYLQTYTCNASDHAQLWEWSGGSPGQIVNQYSGGCINDPGNSESEGTQFIIFACSPVTTNAEFYESAISPPVPTATITSPANGATVSGSSVLIAAKASVSSGSITDISLIAGNTTLLSCSDSSTCYTSWDTTSLTNGTYTLAAYVLASGGGYYEATEKVTVNNSSPSPSPSPNPNPNPSPSPNPNPNPGPSPSPTPKPKSGGSGGGSKGSSGSSGSTLGVSSNPLNQSTLGLNTQPATSGSGDLNTTITNNPEPSITSQPTISNVEATRITSSSITLTWQASDTSSYVIKYGLSANNLPVIKTLTTDEAVPIFTLSSLPAGKDIFIQITPINNGVNGASANVNFKTTGSGSSSLAGALILIALICIAIIFVFIMFRRKRNDSGGSSSDYKDIDVTGAYGADVDASNVQVFPREDTAHEASRLNWWLPEEQRQQAANLRHHNVEDDTPDMYEEGRKRLDDEEKHHKLPGS